MKYASPVHIAAARRSPIGKFGGSLKSLSAVEIARQVVLGALTPDMLSSAELVSAGQVLQAGVGMNGARQLQLACSIAKESPAYTVNMVCGSGLRAVAAVADSVALGEIQSGLGVGMESMSQAPFVTTAPRWGVKYGDTHLRDVISSDGLSDPTLQIPMGETAERIADQFAISREAQDAYAADSQARVAASDFSSELVAIASKEGGLSVDEFPRRDTTVAKLGALRPAFRLNGTVTAGNSSGLNDGAAALFLSSDSQLQRHGWESMARVIGWTSAGCEPGLMGLGPVVAIRRLLPQIGWSLDEVDCFELNEAFAAQCLGCLGELGIPGEKVNPRGGAIALGHPIGCSGARILVSLIHYMRQKRLQKGIAALCIGGGMGIAMAIEC